MATFLKTSRTQVDPLRNAKNDITLGSLQARGGVGGAAGDDRTGVANGDASEPDPKTGASFLARGTCGISGVTPFDKKVETPTPFVV